MLKSKPLPKMFFPSSPRLDRQRILRADVDDAGMRADRVTADGHRFKDGVGVALQNRAVHEGTGVPLVSIADDELLLRFLVGGELPFAAGGETAASAAAQPGCADEVDHLLRGHRGQRFCERPVATGGDVLFDLLGIEAPGVAQHDPRLEFTGSGLFELRIVPVAFQCAGAGSDAVDSGGENGRDLLRRNLTVNHAAAGGAFDEHHNWFGVAEAHAADFAHFDRVFESSIGDLLIDGFEDGSGSGGDAAGPHGNEQFDRRLRPVFQFFGDPLQSGGSIDFHRQYLSGFHVVAFQSAQSARMPATFSAVTFP